MLNLELPLTNQDISIDIFIAVLYLFSVYSIYKILVNKKYCWRMSAIIILICIEISIYWFQTVTTFLTGLRANATLWDIYNLVLLLGISIILNQWSHGKSLEWDKDL